MLKTLLKMHAWALNHIEHMAWRLYMIKRIGDCNAVHTDASPVTKQRKKLVYARGSTFVDWLQIRVKAGKGGDGCVHFLQTRSGSGGPDGGDGGKGGDIKIVAHANLRHLSHLKQRYVAMSGECGHRGRSHGKNGEDVVLEVPIGSVVRDVENGNIVFDFTAESQEVVVAKGGCGGYGNMTFKTSVNRAPMTASPGLAGEEKLIEVELKSIADVGLVGFPNAGKSSLLRALSRAKPLVAAYPFTTLKPHIGIVDFPDLTQIAVADIPGLVKDAHKNRGLGHAFLRHIERCKSLLYVMDITQPNLIEQFTVLKDELECYRTGLSNLPSALVLNKVDIVQQGHESHVNELRAMKLPIFVVSAKELLNINELKEGLRLIVQNKVIQRL